MTWFKVDDGVPDHPKVKRIPLPLRARVMGVWALAGAWCSKHNTDGVVPEFMLGDWTVTPDEDTEWLVKVGLWERTGDGYVFHDWLERQPSRVEVEKKRADHAARQRAYDARRKAKADAAAGVTSEHDAPDASVTHQVNGTDASSDAPLIHPRPDPTRPDPSLLPTEVITSAPPKPTTAKKRGYRLPADWQPSEDLVTWARKECPDVNGRVETEQFKDHWKGAAGATAVKVDWDAAFRTWMRKAQTYAGSLAARNARPARVLHGVPGQMKASY